MKKYIWANGQSFIQNPKLGKVFSSDLTEQMVSYIRENLPHLAGLIEEVEDGKQHVKSVVQDVKK